MFLVPRKKRPSTVSRAAFKKDRTNRGTVDWSEYQKQMEEIAKANEGTFSEQIKKKAEKKRDTDNGDALDGRESSANLLIQLPKARSTIEILDLFRAAAKLTDTGLGDLAASCAFSLRISTCLTLVRSVTLVSNNLPTAKCWKNCVLKAANRSRTKVWTWLLRAANNSTASTSQVRSRSTFFHESCLTL